MSMRARKFIGTNLLILFLGVYSLLAMRLAVYFVSEQMAIQLIYYAFCGVLWVIPAKFLIQWMQKPDD